MFFQEGSDIIDVVANHFKKNSFERHESFVRKISVPRFDANPIVLLQQEVLCEVVDDDRLR